MKNNQEITNLENKITNLQNFINNWKQEVINYENILKKFTKKLEEIKLITNKKVKTKKNNNIK